MTWESRASRDCPFRALQGEWQARGRFPPSPLRQDLETCHNPGRLVCTLFSLVTETGCERVHTISHPRKLTPHSAHTHTRTYIHIHTYTHIHTYIHTCRHTYIHTHIHTYVDRHRSARWFAQSHEDVDTQRPTCRGQLPDDFCNQLLYVHWSLHWRVGVAPLLEDRQQLRRAPPARRHQSSCSVGTCLTAALCRSWSRCTSRRNLACTSMRTLLA